MKQLPTNQRKNFLNYFVKCFCIFAVAFPAFMQQGFAQTPVPMASQGGLTYTENFADIANWTNNFAAGIGASRWGSVAVNATGTIPDGKRTSASTATFVTGGTGGVQKGTGNIVQLSTGTTDNTTSNAIDIFLDFSTVNAGTLTFDWASVNNSTGDRKASLRIYTSTDGTTFTELTAAAVLNVTNNAATSGSITTVALPTGFNNSATARIRFYQYNGTGGTTGSRPKISIDNVTVTAVSSATATLGDITSQPTSTIEQGAIDVPLAGFTLQADASSNFTAVTVTGAGTATSTDLTSVRIFRDNDGNGAINGADASVSGSGIAYGATMNFTISGETGITAQRKYLIVANVAGVGTSVVNDSSRVSIANGAFTTSAATNTGSATGNYRVIVAPVVVEPSTSSTVVFACPDTTSLSATFTGGNGARRIVVMHAGSAVSFTPSDGTAPSGVNSDFSSAVDQGSGNKIVFDGTGTSATFTGLTPGTAYFIKVFEYNGTGAAVDYLTSSFGSASTTSSGPMGYASTGSTYTQNFDSLPSVAGSFPYTGSGPFYLTTSPVCAKGMTGWQFGKTNIAAGNALFNVDNGGSTTGSAYSYGSTSSTDRALGSNASGTTVSNLGIVLKNTTSEILTTVTISYTGEQWRHGDQSTASNLAFSYQIGAPGISNAGFTPVTALNYSSNVFGGTSNVALNGNLSGNRTVIAPQTFNLNANWNPGQTLVLRWDDANDAGADDALSVDDFSFSAIGPVAPTVQDSNITFTNLSTFSLTANWVNGNGTGRIVIINTSNSFTNPTDGTSPTANSNYSGSGQQVVYNGSGSTVNVTGLTPGTTYFFRVYNYNGNTTITKYNTASSTNNPNSTTTVAAAAPTHLVVTSINGGVPPAQNLPFYIVVRPYDANNYPQNVTALTNTVVTLQNGANNLGGTLTGSFANGTNTDTIFGITYDFPELNVVLRDSVISGNALGYADTDPFEVTGAATQLAFTGVPTSGVINTPIGSFSVLALNDGIIVDQNYTDSITISVFSGPVGGVISGTLIKRASAGLVTFSGIQFNIAGTYVLAADAPGLLQGYSDNIVITNVPVMTELVIPKYIGAKTGATTNNARTPIALCFQIDNLVPGVVYDVKAGLDTTTASVASYGGGNIWSSAITSFTGGNQIIPNAFTANGSGSSGPYWIYIQPTTARFDAGQVHNLRVGFVAHGGSFPTSPNCVGTKTITALDIANTARTTATTDDGAFMKGATSSCVNGKFILVYDNIAGTGDPLFSYQARQAVDTNTSQSELPSSINDIFTQSGTSSLGDWPAVIPIGANNPNGVRRIEARNYDNTIFNSAIDSNGVWPGGANTTTITRRSVASLTLADAGMNTVTNVSISSTPSSCAGTNDGTATVSATGMGTLSYLWSNSQTTAAITNLASGTYSVTITDTPSGCTASTSVVVQQPATSTITPAGPISFCDGDSALLTAGAGANHYSWSTNPSTDTLQSVYVKTAGSYTVTVTTGTCTQTSLPVVVTVNTFTVTGTIFNENMGDAPVGATTVVNSFHAWHNGAPIVFSSSPDSAQTDVRTSTPSNTYSGASAGNNVFFSTASSLNNRNFNISGISTIGYSNITMTFGVLRSAVGVSTDSLKVEVSTDGITYTPAGSYTTTSTTVWAQFTAPAGSVPVTSNLRIRFSKNNTSQFRVDDVKLTGTTSTVSISANGPTTICDSGSVILTSNIPSGNLWSSGQTTQSITLTSTGTRTVTATDINGCKATSAPVSVLVDPRPVVSVSATPATCATASDGTATASATGSGTLSYSWTSTPVQTTATATGLPPGTYSVTVTSSLSGCATTKTVTVGQPTFSVIVAGGPTTFCLGDSVLLSAGGGTTYTWSNGSTTQSIYAKTSGSYTVTVDSAGCIQTSAPVVVTVNTFAMNGTIFSESNDSTTANINVNTYTKWQNTAPVTFTSTSSTQSSVRNSNPSSGYSGSSGFANIFMGFTNGSPDRDFIISGINTLGYSGILFTFGVRRDANSADSIFVAYSTDGISYTPLTIRQPATLNTWQLDTAVGSIPATDNLRIRFYKNSTSAQFRVDDVKLTGITTTVNIAVTGSTTICGTAGVRLTSNILTGNTWAPTGQTTKSILAVASGSYTVTSSGSTGCPATSAPVVVTINPNPTVSITSTTNLTCYNDSSGSATAVGSGGTGTLNYSWNSVPPQFTSTASNLKAGIYKVTVTDVNGCMASDSDTISQPAPIEIIVFFPSGCAPDVISIIGANFTGVTDVLFNGVSAASFTVNNDSLIEAEVPVGATTGPITIVKGPCTVTSVDLFTITCTGGATVSLKAIVQGYYIGGGMMNAALYYQDQNQGTPNFPIVNNPDQVDTVIVSAYNESTFELVDSYKGVLDINGNVSGTMSLVTSGSSYYLGIKFRNALETWTPNPVTLSDSTGFDFTSNVDSSLGSNTVDIGAYFGESSLFACWSGDMNHDGFVDVFDYPIFEEDNVEQVFGYSQEWAIANPGGSWFGPHVPDLTGADAYMMYLDPSGYSLTVLSDLTGDGFVDVFDYSSGFFEQNNFDQRQSIHF